MAPEQLIAIAGFILVAAITPGPNNLIVLTMAGQGGLRAALPPALGIIAGSLALLVVAWFGATAAFSAEPRLRLLLAVLGALYLSWLGARLIWWPRGVMSSGEPARNTALPRSGLGLAGFQFLNPKSWVLVMTAIAASRGDAAGLSALAVMFVVIPGLCLSLWAWAGLAMASWLERPAPRRIFECCMGILLIGSAVLLFV